MKRPSLSPIGETVRRVRLTVQTTVDRAKDNIRQARAWERGQRSLLDALAPEWVEHHPDAYVIGAQGQETWTRTLCVQDWPPRVIAGWLAPFVFDLGGDVSLALHVDRIPQGQAIRRLRAQRVLQTSVQQARMERGAISDPAEQLDLASAEDVAQAVAAGTEALFSVGLAITLRAPDSDALSLGRVCKGSPGMVALA